MKQFGAISGLLLAIMTIWVPVSSSGASASQSHAQNAPIKNSSNEGVSIKKLVNKFTVPGTGPYVCASEESMIYSLFVARGNSVKEAKALALETCKSAPQSDSFFCQERDCERDETPGGHETASFYVDRNKPNRVYIENKQGSQFQCIIEGKEGEFVGRATTRTESLVLAHRLCVEEEARRRQSSSINGWACKADLKKCEKSEAGMTRPSVNPSVP